MQPQLSIILPVQNLANSVSLRIQRLLEFSGDLTKNFEILVVDDFSSDQTGEIVTEMARSYPQIRLIQNYCEKGFAKSIETGFQHTRAKRVFVVEMGVEIQPALIRKFWFSGAPNNLFQLKSAKPVKPLSENLLDRLDAWGVQLKQEQSRSNTSNQKPNQLEKAKPQQTNRETAQTRGQSRIDQPQAGKTTQRMLRIPIKRRLKN